MINPSLKDIKLSSKELKILAKLLAKERGIKGYESIPEDKLLSALKASESQNNFDETRIKKIREENKKLGHKFAKSEIKEIRKNLYEIKNEKSLSAAKEIEEYLLGLEKNLSKLKNYYDYDDAEYRGIKDVKDLVDLSIDEDYYKPMITKSAFNNNYIRYGSRGNKDKILTVNEYLEIIRPYLRDIINDHKTQGEWRIHSGNTRTNHKTQSEWKIQLTTKINFISSKPDSGETRTMPTKSNNVELMMGSETDDR